ncbi:Enoyl-[acyl-carrier-protein] reductase [NADH] [Dyadobacter sp. SG02]|uniref:SDR family NAD(P)-dependent oxidoreductase n=1 Tax=Dyadobacter sp. SG02 TaxID=1855291 RepID=UPI0008CDA694|nr:SDR family oxidoreductase [Dyadobacter sp. SG02]SEJ59721.1 Enoyl-[acyl-carrier-protein] reductase [NADH] [Dyadobacter sp. SG02]
MQLQTKNAIIFGAGGSLGGAVAQAFAVAGAKVFLSGIHSASVEKVAAAIRAAGGLAETRQVDALDKTEVDAFVAWVADQAGSVDIAFNAIGLEDVQDIPLTDMDVEDFTRPILRAMRSQFLTGTAAGRVMSKQGKGVILALTATPGGIGYPGTGGFGTACCAIESFTRNLASELGRFGVRVVCIRSGGSPDSQVFIDAFAHVGHEIATQIIGGLAKDTMLKKLPKMQDIAHVAVFAASDQAALITGTTIDVTGGTTSALNYKTSEDGPFIPPFQERGT